MLCKDDGGYLPPSPRLLYPKQNALHKEKSMILTTNRNDEGYGLNPVGHASS